MSFLVRIGEDYKFVNWRVYEFEIGCAKQRRFVV